MSSRTTRGPAFSKPRSKLRKWLPAMLLLGAIGCLVVAFQQFRLSQEVRVATVILVLDASNSMDQTDVTPTRLEAAQEAAGSFLEESPPDFRVGLVTFAGEAEVRARPTLDRATVRAQLDAIELAGGTVIGDGLSAAIDSLLDDWRANGEGPAAILLLSDGLDTGSEVPPLLAADRARGLGIPVFTVLLGEPQATEDGGLNSDLLGLMATTTGARTFTAGTAGELERVYADLGSGLSVELAVTDIGLPFLVAAGILGLAAGFALVRGSEGADWR